MKTEPILSTDSSTTVPSVITREGNLIDFDPRRIIRALSLASFEVLNPKSKNPHRDSAANLYGLETEAFGRATELTLLVTRSLVQKYSGSPAVRVEEIQDEIESVLLAVGEFKLARAYSFYRRERAALRLTAHSYTGIDEFVGIDKYSRYSSVLKRREIWGEAAARPRDMHLRRYAKVCAEATPERIKRLIENLVAEGVITPQAAEDMGDFKSLGEEIADAFDLVVQKKVLPSMRSMQFGGQACEVNHTRVYNCSFSHADRLEFFAQYFFVLLSGCGVGFSVQKHHVAKLPPIASEVVTLPSPYFVEDTIEGWAKALEALITGYVNGERHSFDYSLIRPKGAILKTSGGRAPGPEPLSAALEKIGEVLDGARGRKLRPIEVYDILMFAAKSVLSGGIRRSATICLFSADDEEMMKAKTGDWLTHHPQRSASNNSAVILRNSCTREEFDRLFECQRQFGEPGFFFADSTEVGTNPCAEIGLYSVLNVTEADIPLLRKYGYTGDLSVGMQLSGFQFCNLTTIAGRAAKTFRDFFMLSRAAALIGTLQAGYTDFRFLGPVTRLITEKEALLGVSICGVLDNPDVLLDPGVLRRGAEVVKATNAVVAALIGINPAARTTCVKPEGTSSILLNSGSGIHPHHARHYIRHVQANVDSPVYQLFKRVNPHACDKSVYDQSGNTDVIAFPMTAPENAILAGELSGPRFLEIVKLVQENWVMPGQARTDITDAHHNVSNTTVVDEGDWSRVADYIWENRSRFTGIALLARTGDKAYAQAPRVAISNEKDIQTWNRLSLTPVDYTLLPDEDESAGHEARSLGIACAGGACELV